MHPGRPGRYYVQACSRNQLQPLLVTPDGTDASGKSGCVRSDSAEWQRLSSHAVVLALTICVQIISRRDLIDGHL